MIILVFLLIVVLLCFFKKVKIFDEFKIGAKEGIESAFSLLPTLIALILAVKMLQNCGIIDFLTAKTQNFPKEAVMLSLLKPISGSGSLALLESIFQTNHPDSFIGKLCSLIFCSYDTVFYVISVYFGSVNYKKGGKVIFAALCGYILSVFLSFIFIKLEAFSLF